MHQSISDFSFGRRRYLRQIQSANKVISILKPYIADNGLPNEKIMSAIIASTARKYGVEINELYKIKVFCEELIKEIVENVYVSSETKKEYTDQLADYINNISIDGKKEMEVVSKTKEAVARKDIGIDIGLFGFDMLITIFASLLMAVKDTEKTGRCFRLAASPGRVFTKAQIFEAVWSMGSESCQSSVASVICNLRKKIEPDSRNPTYIKTVLGIGYKFVSGE